jgi:hypothetical protein
MDRRLIGGTPLQVVGSDQPHIKGFRRRADHLLLCMHTRAARDETHRDKREKKAPALHHSTPTVQSQSALAEADDITRKAIANTHS